MPLSRRSATMPLTARAPTRTTACLRLRNVGQLLSVDATPARVKRAHAIGRCVLGFVCLLALGTGLLAAALITHVLNGSYWSVVGLLCGVVLVLAAGGGAIYSWSNENRVEPPQRA
jgi:hypothetical protein